MPTKPIAPPYDNVRQAFQHFKQDELARGYAPWDERNDGEWVMVYFWQTHTVRLFPTLESVSQWYAWSIYRSCVFLSWQDLNLSFTTTVLRKCYEKLSGEETDLSGAELAKACWILAQEKGEKLPKQRGVRSRGENRNVYTVDVQALRSEEGIAKLATLPKQARVIGTAFGEQGKTSYTEEELRTFGNELIIQQKLKTKQDVFRVIAYYAPVLYDLGFLEYPGRRRTKEPEPENYDFDAEDISDAA